MLCLQKKIAMQIFNQENVVPNLNRHFMTSVHKKFLMLLEYKNITNIMYNFITKVLHKSEKHRKGKC